MSEVVSSCPRSKHFAERKENKTSFKGGGGFFCASLEKVLKV